MWKTKDKTYFRGSENCSWYLMKQVTNFEENKMECTLALPLRVHHAEGLILSVNNND
jgi:hypothetical protein